MLAAELAMYKVIQIPARIVDDWRPLGSKQVTKSE